MWQKGKVFIASYNLEPFHCLQVSRNLTDDDGNNLWPEFLKFLFELASSENPDTKESSLLLFGACPTIFGDQV